MNILWKLAYTLGLVEDRIEFTSLERVPSDLLVIPAGARVEGQIHTALNVVVAGAVDGTVNIRGEARLIVLEGGEVNNGLLSANSIEVGGILRNAHVDAERLVVSPTGKVLGKSHVRYGRLAFDEEATMTGIVEKRKTIRDGAVHLPRPIIDTLVEESGAAL